MAQGGAGGRSPVQSYVAAAATVVHAAASASCAPSCCFESSCVRSRTMRRINKIRTLSVADSPNIRRQRMVAAVLPLSVPCSTGCCSPSFGEDVAPTGLRRPALRRKRDASGAAALLHGARLAFSRSFQ
eukprot:351935-Chlamydomonas_euryale.AAC.3